MRADYGHISCLLCCVIKEERGEEKGQMLLLKLPDLFSSPEKACVCCNTLLHLPTTPQTPNQREDENRIHLEDKPQAFTTSRVVLFELGEKITVTRTTTTAA